MTAAEDERWQRASGDLWAAGDAMWAEFHRRTIERSTDRLSTVRLDDSDILEIKIDSYQRLDNAPWPIVAYSPPTVPVDRDVEAFRRDLRSYDGIAGPTFLFYTNGKFGAPDVTIDLNELGEDEALARAALFKRLGLSIKFCLRT